MSTVKVLLFGSLAENFMDRSVVVEGVDTVGQLVSKLKTDHVEFSKAGFRISVNRMIVGDNHLLSDGDEVAALPPFSGG